MATLDAPPGGDGVGGAMIRSGDAGMLGVSTWTLRFLAGLAAISALALLAAGCTTDSAETTSEEFAGLVDIGDRDIYMECSGSGSPTVILMSGLGSAADLWNLPDQAGPAVFPEVAKTTRVCAYDRPGAPLDNDEPSRSDDVAQPISAQDSVDDLHALLEAGDIPGPYVLAAHSYAGTIARIYAGKYPSEVAGIVFVDVLTPELREGMTDEWWKAWVTFSEAVGLEPVALYPAWERLEFDESLDQVEAAPALRPMPVVVLSANVLYGQSIEAEGQEGNLPRGVPPELGYVVDSANKGAQIELAQLVPGTKHITNTESGHEVMVDNAQLVTDSIVEVVDAVRDERSALTE